mmetsp:Transcript_11959/g.1797  ORF Transcript_11959/g.1797 Transcript_11959/m.1797 type:complete len:91 (+) Transcript_11959:307-579(+)
MNTIDQLLEEMNNFELVPDDSTIVNVCQAYKETGNCLFRGTCKHPHTLNYDEIQIQLRKQSWFPGSADCGCCKGYKYGCQTCGAEECQTC